MNPLLLIKDLPPYAVSQTFLRLMRKTLDMPRGRVHKMDEDDVPMLSSFLKSHMSEKEEGFFAEYHGAGLFIFKCDKPDADQGKVFFVFIPLGDASFQDCAFVAAENSQGELLQHCFEEYTFEGDYYLTEAFPNQKRFYMGRYIQPVKNSMAILLADLSERRECTSILRRYLLDNLPHDPDTFNQ